MEGLLMIDGLRKAFRTGNRTVTAVDDVDLEIRSGEIVGFLGPNGAGKTTVIKCACGLIEPDAGTIRVAGFDSAAQRAQALRNLGAVLEGARNIYWQLSPRENIWYFGQMRGVPTREIRRTSEHLLQSLGIAGVANQPVKSLSRGNQQRVAMAVALVHHPTLVLLDEPTLGLDVESTVLVVNAIRQMAVEEGKGVLLTTHQMALAEELCDRIAVISQGKILYHNTTARLLAQFERGRGATYLLDDQIAAEEQAALVLTYPGLQIQPGGQGVKLFLPSESAVTPEQLFFDLWQTEHTITSFSRRTSLQDVYLQIVGGSVSGEQEGNHATATDD